ncbi:hypothetical protein OS493_013652 [Desmophyllum pertusum]|uniref:Uncharacterized protein n=1 Tax=Desmophyllum pertusum TaxID=174260 RepID=A0A9X0A2J6_9CNID|nr:hypothetical protein OS493_013652 [Desmophyllum pertusum]
MNENASNEENEEESPDISDEASDESDGEDNENTEQLSIPAEERQETGVKSRDIQRDTADLSSEGVSDDVTTSVPGPQSVDEMETVSIGASSHSQLFAQQGIFSGSPTYGEKKTGPMITEIVMDTGT